jgi:tetratricopeptide (TPR) repeat protein
VACIATFGNANGVRREYERAIHYFDLAYRANPGFHQALIAGAVLRYRELGNVDGAIALSLRALLEQSPEHGGARFNRAWPIRKRVATRKRSRICAPFSARAGRATRTTVRPSV